MSRRATTGASAPPEDDGAGPSKRARTGEEASTPPVSSPLPAPPPSAAASPPPPTVTIGGVPVCAIGLGTLPAGVAYPHPDRRPDDAAFRALLAAAIAAAAPARLLVDTADTYCTPCTDAHMMERALGAAETPSPSGGPAPPFVVSTKSGMKRLNDESRGWRPGASGPAAVTAAIRAAHAALGGRGPVFMWSFHHLDG